MGNKRSSNEEVGRGCQERLSGWVLAACLLLSVREGSSEETGGAGRHFIRPPVLLCTPVLGLGDGARVAKPCALRVPKTAKEGASYHC